MNFLVLSLSILALTTGSLADLKSDYLNTHNKVRNEHRVGNLQWDISLINSAQKNVNKCKFEHSVISLVTEI